MSDFTNTALQHNPPACDNGISIRNVQEKEPLEDKLLDARIKREERRLMRQKEMECRKSRGGPMKLGAKKM